MAWLQELQQVGHLEVGHLAWLQVLEVGHLAWLQELEVGHFAQSQDSLKDEQAVGLAD